jgi:glutathione S-transferase
LEHGDTLVVESDVVAKYVAQNLGNDVDLYPELDQERIGRFLSLWETVVDDYYDLLRATSSKHALRYEKAFVQSLQSVEDQFDNNGDFVLEDRFSLAECISAPWVQRFFETLPYFRGIDFEEGTLKTLPRTARWMKAVCERPSVKASKCPRGEMLNAAKRYYVSYWSPGAPL